MRYLFTIALIVITTALSWMGYRLYSDPEWRKQFYSQEESKLEKPLYDFDHNKVKSVSITLPNGGISNYEWQPKNAQWLCVKPWGDRAVNINTIIQFALEAEVHEFVPVADKPISELQFGNAPRITIKDNEGNSLADFHLGRKSAWHIRKAGIKKAFPTLYIRRVEDGESADTLLCHDPTIHFHKLFEKDLVRLRDTLPVNRLLQRNVGKLRLTRNGTDIEVGRSKKNPNSWEITKPLVLRPDNQALAQYLYTIHGLFANRLLKASDVTLPAKNEKTIELGISYLGRPDETVLTIYPPEDPSTPTALATISDRPNVVFELPLTPSESGQQSYTTLPASVNDIRSRKILPISNLALIDRISISSPERRPVRLARQHQVSASGAELHTDWSLIEGKDREFAINPVALEEFFIALTKDRIVNFVSDAATDLAPYGLETPFRRIDIVDTSKQMRTLLLGRVAGKKEIFATIAGSNKIWELSSETVLRIKPDPWQWKTTQLWDYSIAELKKASIYQAGYKAPLELTYNHFAAKVTGLQGEKNVTKELNNDSCLFFMRRLADLKMSGRLGPASVAASNALKEPSLLIDLQFEPLDAIDNIEPVKKRILIAPATRSPRNQIYYARVSGEADFFRLDKETYQDLAHSLFQQ